MAKRTANHQYNGGKQYFDGEVQTSGDVYVDGALNVSGRITEKLTVTDVDATDNTLTAAQAKAGIVVHTSATSGGDVTMDTAANYISGIPLDADNECVAVNYINDGDQTLTLAVASGTTITDTGNTILTNEAAILLICRTSSTAVVVHPVSS
tara:strand:- start:462 stop:917 length:456 start_codon:yes stop_codon:yes gene_type:complete